MAVPPNPPPPTPSVFANRYELVGEIAHGGMADVYLARDDKLDRPVAVKVLTAELSRDPAFVERFRREAQAAANLNHPNIVSIYDWGQERGMYFIVMEYVDGRTLGDVIRAQGPLPPATIAEIGEKIAAALSFAHRHGVVHRDIKPGNVLITDGGEVKVTDFGIARAGAGAEALTQTGSVMGTATYFSPEQAQGLPVDGRSDVYSLGVVLYEMTAGGPPFSGDTPVAVAYQHVREALPPLSDRRPDVPPALEQIIVTALAKQPEHRYASADDLRADLLRFERGEAIAGVPLTGRVTQIAETQQVAATRAATAVAPLPVTTPPPPPGGRRERTGVIVAVAAILVALAALVTVLLLTLGGGGSAKKIAVADVVNMTEAKARDTLTKQGFKVNIDRVPNEKVKRGTVFDQDPNAGTRFPKGETVLLRVSDGVGTVTVPDVTDQPFESAKATIVAKGFTVKRVDEPSDTIDVGMVTRTDPKAGSKADKGSEVVVFVASGKTPVTVPNVDGDDQVAATQTLANAGFVVQKVLEPSATVPAGAVIRTDPRGGTQAAKGSTVRMFVSSGPEQVTVPGVVGDTQADATSALQAAGFKVSVVEVSSTAANQGRVISQDPAGGETAERGSTVTITVGTGPPPSSTTSTTT